MEYKVKSLTKEQIGKFPNSLQESIQKEIDFLKKETDNFSDKYYNIFKKNDDLIFDLVTSFKLKTSPPPNKIPDLDWKKVAPSSVTKSAKDVKLNCGLQAVQVKEETNVTVKQIAKPGDWVLIHEDNRPFAVMGKQAFNKRCDEFQEKTTAKQKIKDTLSQKKKAVSSSAKSKAKSSCSIENYPDALPAPLELWFQNEVSKWKNGVSKLKVEGVYWIRNSGEVVAKMKDYSLKGKLLGRPIYYKICLNEGTKSNTRKPRRGSYRLLINKDELRKSYLKDPKMFSICRKWIREAYRCKAGSCKEGKRKELYQKYYQRCTDPVAKKYNATFWQKIWELVRAAKSKPGETLRQKFSRIYKGMKTDPK